MGFWEKILVSATAIGTAFLAYSWLTKKDAWAGSDRVLVLGDSIVASPGFLSTLREGFGPGVEVKLVSLAGQGTGPIKDAGLEAAHSWQPDVVIVLAGVNDLASGRGWQHAANNLNNLYNALEDMGIYVVAVRLTPWTQHIEGAHLQGETKKLNDWITKHKVPVATVYTDDVAPYTGRDGLHLSRHGGKKLAELVLYSVRL